MIMGHGMDLHAGIIDNPVTVERITKRLALEGNQEEENLTPIFNADGKVVAYERSLDPAQLSGMGYKTNLAQMAGVWRGRQVQEDIGQKFNEQLVDKLHEMYDKDTHGGTRNKEAYLNLWNPKSYGDDPVIKDAMALMTACAAERNRKPA